MLLPSKSNWQNNSRRGLRLVRVSAAIPAQGGYTWGTWCYALERGYYVFLLMLIGGAVLCVSSVTSVVHVCSLFTGLVCSSSTSILRGRFFLLWCDGTCFELRRVLYQHRSYWILSYLLVISYPLCDILVVMELCRWCSTF